MALLSTPNGSVDFTISAGINSCPFVGNVLGALDRHEVVRYGLVVLGIRVSRRSATTPRQVSLSAILVWYDAKDPSCPWGAPQDGPTAPLLV